MCEETIDCIMWIWQICEGMELWREKTRNIQTFPWRIQMREHPSIRILYSSWFIRQKKDDNSSELQKPTENLEEDNSKKSKGSAVSNGGHYFAVVIGFVDNSQIQIFI